jgi:hypothetical protein
MKLLQLVFLGLFLSFGAQQTSAQIYRFKTSSLSVMEKDDKGKWKEWSEFGKAELIITLDGTKNRITVNSLEMQLFKIISYGEKISTEYDDTLTFECQNNDGGACTIMIVTRKNQNNRMQFYINYNDVKMVYNIYNVE